MLPNALDKVKEKIQKMLEDGAYDFKLSYKIASKDIQGIIPPRSNAVKDNKTS